MHIRSVLVTGGAGYVGAVLVPKLLHKGYRVKVVDWYIFDDHVFHGVAHHPNLEQIRGDIRSISLLKKALVGIDAVVHLASISNDPSYDLDPTLGKSVNYDATVALVDLAKASGVKRFVYASTSSVYGVKREKEVTEDLPLKPLTDYSKYKALSEKYLLAQGAPGFTALVIRPATVCGYSPRMRLDLTVNILTINALVHKKIIVYGGSQKRPNIHMDDMTDLYVKTLAYPDGAIAGKIYNAGYQNYTISALARMVKTTIGDPAVRIKREPTNDLRSYHVSSKKIARELGFVPKRSVQNAIVDVQKAYRAGKIPRPFDNPRYYNIKTMQAFGSGRVHPHTPI